MTTEYMRSTIGSKAATPSPNKCFLQPNGARLVVERDGFSYKGNLIIPDKAKQMPTTGIVMRAGEGLEYLVGKRVLWNFLSGSPITFRNKPCYHILNIEEILAIVETNEELETEPQSSM